MISKCVNGSKIKYCTALSWGRFIYLDYLCGPFWIVYKRMTTQAKKENLYPQCWHGDRKSTLIGILWLIVDCRTVIRKSCSNLWPAMKVSHLGIFRRLWKHCSSPAQHIPINTSVIFPGNGNRRVSEIFWVWCVCEWIDHLGESPG